MSRVIFILFLLASLLLPLAAGADPIGWSAPRQLAPDTAAVVDQAWHSTGARDSALWALWLEDRGTGQHLLKASRFSQSSWSWLEPESVASDTTWVYFVETAVDADLSPWAVWNCNWSRRKDDSWTLPRLITRDTAGLRGDPGVASDPVQGIWAIWPKIEGDSVSILSSYSLTDSWAPQALVARFYWWFVPYVTALTAPPGGKVRSVWTGALSSGIGIYSATWDGDSWEKPEFVPSSSVGYWPSVCSDSVGGTWVTWCDGFAGDSALIRCAHHDGTGWADTWRLATGNLLVYRGMLCCDEQGWIWALWVQLRGASDTADICVRHFDGDSWSDRSVVTTCARLTIYPKIAAALGRVWVTWTQEESAGRELLYYSHTLPPGIAEQEQQRLAAVQVSPSVVRGVLFLPTASSHRPQATSYLLDVSGRNVAELHPGVNDVRRLGAGVYFVRQAQAQAQAQAIRKVVLTE